MTKSLQQSSLFLLFKFLQWLVVEIIKRVDGISWLRSPVGTSVFVAATLIAYSFFVPSSWRFSRRLMRFTSLQCIVLALMIILSGWEGKVTLQEIVSSQALYLFSLLPIPIIWMYKD